MDSDSRLVSSCYSDDFKLDPNLHNTQTNTNTHKHLRQHVKTKVFKFNLKKKKIKQIQANTRGKKYKCLFAQYNFTWEKKIQILHHSKKKPKPLL